MMLMVVIHLWIFGKEWAKTTIFFPILVDISRFENAMYKILWMKK